METSFVEFRQYGFWVDDRLLRLWLYFLVVEVRKLPKAPLWLREASGNWRQQSTVRSQGSVNMGLDEYITTPARDEILVAISAAAQSSVQRQGEYLLRKNLVDCELIGYSHRIPASDVREVAAQFIKLLKGQLTSRASSQEARSEAWAPKIDLTELACETDNRDYPQAVLRAIERSAGEDNVAIIPGHSPLPQPDNVFSFAEYKFYIREANTAWWEATQAYLGNHPEWCDTDAEFYGKKRTALESVLIHYIPQLPVYLLARCPLCGGRVSESVDTFSFNGMGWNNKQMEPSGRGWLGYTDLGERFVLRPANSYHSECEHAQLMLYGVNLNGCEKFDNMCWNSIFMGAERPYIIPPLLQLADTSAVMHSLPLGRLSDSEFVPRYTIYFTTYFTSHVETFNRALELYRTQKGPPRISPYNVADYDLISWVKAGRLYWLDNTDPDLALAGTSLNQPPFPYANIVGREGRWFLSRSKRRGYTLQQLDPFFDGWFGY